MIKLFAMMTRVSLDMTSHFKKCITLIKEATGGGVGEPKSTIYLAITLQSDLS